MLKAREIEPLKGKPRLKVWLFGALSGVLLTLSQPPLDIPLVGLVALLPLLIALPRLSPGGSWLMGWLVGMPYFWVNQWWLGQMVTDPGNEWIIFAMFAFVATAQACFFGFAAMQARWLLTRQGYWPMLLVPLVWLGFEFAHEFYTPAPYPWLPLGLSLADFTLFAQTADIWGQYGLTFSCVFFALGLSVAVGLDGPAAKLTRRTELVFRRVLPGAALVLVLLGCVYGFVRIRQIEARETGDGPLIACVQGNLAQEVKVSNDPERLPKSWAEHMQLTEQGVQQGAELVCWAETMLFGGTTRDGLMRGSPELAAPYFPDNIPDQRLLNSGWYPGNLRARIYYDLKTPMLVGAITEIPQQERIHAWKDYERGGRVYNTALLYDAQGKPVASYDKRYLVPGGEYIPLENLELAGWAPVRDIVEGYSQGLQGYTSRVEPGLRTTTFRLPGKAERLKGRAWAFTTTICYEYAWPGCYIELHEKPERYPDFHINISNEGWFKESAELDQAVDFCRIRCIESRVPMVRATNTGITCTIDAAGRVRELFTVNGKDREVGGVMLARPDVLDEPQATMFVLLVNRGLGWLGMLLLAPVALAMVAGRIQERMRRKRVASAQAEAKPGTGS
ncbi:MAG: apolipoprotein N-acyltransferase [Planctomycetes bacterium]|nr:apolipoprotein N-acyltransferase [Planctomycetota bacterium]MCW8136785.1 apolipoprotein N-acyltransferase [Planctomycetota bacterium]